MAEGAPKMTETPLGPFESREQAMSHPAVREIHEAARMTARPGVLFEGKHRLLCEALSGARVDLGAFDDHVALHLAGDDVHTVAVIAGWIARAHEAPHPCSVCEATDQRMDVDIIRDVGGVFQYQLYRCKNVRACNDRKFPQLAALTEPVTDGTEGNEHG